MKTALLLVVSLLFLSASAFAASLACEPARESARLGYNQSIADIDAGVKAGEISKRDAIAYLKNAALLLAQGEATCFALGE